MEFLFLFSFLPLHTNVVYIYIYNSHVFSINPLSRVNTFVIIFCRGRVVSNVASTCDPTLLYYMQLNIIKLKRDILNHWPKVKQQRNKKLYCYQLC